MSVSGATQSNPALAAAIAATQSAASASASTSNSSASASGAGASSSTAQQTGQTALNALSGNFTDFLGMLMTQLQNQDPTSPMDSNTFTQELVSFSGVEQQISTNNSLTQLIQLTQSGQTMQASAMDGKQVTVQSNQIPLQNGSGSVQFTAPSAEPVAIAIANSSGQQIRDVTLNATAGQNNWTWNGTDNNGNTVPDGAYNIAVIGTNADNSTTALPFTVTGTATGVQSTSNNGMQLELGALPVSFGDVRSVGN